VLGSGTDPKDVSGLIKSFGMIRDIMKAMSSMSIMDRMRNVIQFMKMAATGMMPKFRDGNTTQQKRKESRADKRARRKKHKRQYSRHA
jgi:signal recognition particle GTPase